MLLSVLLNDTAPLEGVGAGTITAVCSIPAILFSLYVIFDDRRQARHAAHGGTHGAHDAAHDVKVSPPVSHREPGADAAKPH